MNRMFVGRKRELARLQRCLDEDLAQLIVVYGRRRVGKTFLVNQFFEGRFDFKVTGIYNQPKSVQLRSFSEELRRHTGRPAEIPKDWLDAFNQLRDYLEGLQGNEKRVIFFDEMPWLDTQKSDFLPAFEWFWNDYACARDRLIVIVCGSATSWMVENIEENKGGLFNRQTCKLFLEPFTLSEVEDYLKLRGISWARYDIAQCYMMMGGYPYYLSLLDPEKTLFQNADELFFRKRAELWDEYDHLYRTLFSNSNQYIRVVETLAKRNYGMSRERLSSESGLPSNGMMSKILKNLVDSGFVRREAVFGKKNETIYQLSDYYSLFYFRFIRDGFGGDEHFWSNQVDHPARRVWAGLAFEMLCKDHIAQIKQKLSIGGVLSEQSTWQVGPDPEQGRSGAQIDLVINRRDQVINLCEAKFSINAYEISRDYDQKLRDKIEIFRESTKTRKTLQLTLITTFGIKKNPYSSLINQTVTLDDLFVPLS